MRFFPHKTILIALMFTLAVSSLSAAHRIVSLSPAMTELICTLGAEKELVGRSSACDWPEQIKCLPIAGDFAKPDLEKVIALEPDIVVTNDLIQPSVANALNNQGIRVVNLQCRNLAEYENAVKTLSALLGRREEGSRELASIEKAKKTFSSLPRLGQNVLILIWDNPPVIAAGNTFPNELLKMAGAGEPDFLGKTGYFTPNSEWLMHVHTDTLLMFKDPVAVRQHPLLKELNAVKNNRIVVIDNPSLLQRPGPRWAEGVRTLREKLEALSSAQVADGKMDRKLDRLRFWRTVAAFLIGSALSMAGLVFQTIFRNPLATPYTLGISSGAAAGAAAMFIFFSGGILAFLVPTGAFAGAMLTLAVVLLVSGAGRGGTDKLLLSGVIAGTIVSSLLIYLISIADSDELAGVTWWMLGDLQAIEPDALKLLGGFVLLALILIRWFANDLNAMALGDETAVSLGVRLNTVRLTLIVTAALLASFCVSLAGMIGFVGLIVPHLVRRIAGNDLRKTVLLTFFSGGIFLMVCDFASRFVDPVRQTPIGVLTACVGGILFLILLKRRPGGFSL